MADTADNQSSGLSTLGPVKITGGGKGTLATVEPVGGMALDEASSKSILNNMQQMLNEYNDPLRKAQTALQQAHAWTMYDKTPGFAEANRREQEELANRYNIAQSMASMQAMQNMENIAKQKVQGIVNGSSTIPGAAGTAAEHANFAADPNVQARLATVLSYQAQLQILNDAAKTEFGNASKGRYEASGNTQVLQNVPGYGLQMISPNEILEFKVTGKLPDRITGGAPAPKPASGAQPAPAAAPAATPTSTPGPSPFSDPSIKIISGHRDTPVQTALYAKSVANGTPGVLPDGTPVAKPGTSVHEGPEGDAYDIDHTTLTPSGRLELAQKNYYQPLGKDDNHWIKIGAKAPVAQMNATIQAADTSGMPDSRNFTSPEAYKAAVDAWKTQQAESAKAKAASETKERDAAGKYISDLETQSADWKEVSDAAKRVSKHAAEHPEEFGWAEKKGPLAGFLAGIEMIPHFGPGAEQAAERVYSAAAPSVSQEAINRRNQTNTDAGKLGLDFAKQQFSGSGARLGLGLVNIAQQAKGVGAQYPAAVNKLNADLIDVAAEKRSMVAEAWDKYKKANQPSPDPYAFMQTDAKKAIDKWAEDELRRRQPEFSKQADKLPATSGGEGEYKTTPSGVKYRIVK